MNINKVKVLSLTGYPFSLYAEITVLELLFEIWQCKYPNTNCKLRLLRAGVLAVLLYRRIRALSKYVFAVSSGHWPNIRGYVD